MTKFFCQELVNSKPLFMAVYATVIVGIVVSSFYVFYTMYLTNSTVAYSLLNTICSPQLDKLLDHSQQMTVENATPYIPHFQSMRVNTIWEAPLPNTKMPTLDKFRLTKELVHPRVKNNTIIVTFGNYAFMDFILNWVKHLTDKGLSNLLVGALDTELLEALYWKGIPVFDMGIHMSSTDVGWGSSNFHKIGRQKVLLINDMLPFGYEILMTDTDVVWLKNPLPYLSRYPEADILTSTDQVEPTVVDDGLDNWKQVDSAYNIGIFHWRPTDSVKKFAKEWKDMLVADDAIWDQTAFNYLLREHLGPSVNDDSGLVYAYNRNLKLGLLPASIFCGGHTYFVQAMHRQLNLEPYAVHTTFQYAGTEGKRHRLREAKLFYDLPEYYDGTEGFMTFKPDIPKSLLYDGEHNLEKHFALVNYQIKQIRTALAIASLLNRTLVMPPLWCRLDRLWYPHPGVLEGSLTRQPFLCPLDHVFQVDNMLKDWPEEDYGPGINFREYSFLDNPFLPTTVTQSWLDVQLCQEGSEDCHASTNFTDSGVLRFPKRSTEHTFMAVFSPFKDVKVIQFSSMQDAFTSFSEKRREERFRRRMKRYVGIWCCVLNHNPGNIYYDMYWDEKPNWKPIPDSRR